MSETLICLSILLSLPLALWLGSLYFDGDFSECFGAALTPWPISLLMGSFTEHFGKALKFEIFMIGFFLCAYGIFATLSALAHWIVDTVIPFFG